MCARCGACVVGCRLATRWRIAQSASCGSTRASIHANGPHSTRPCSLSIRCACTHTLHFKHRTQLLTEYATNATIKRYVDTLNFYIVPVLNPDGYKYTWSSPDPRKRMWRKNRNLQGGRRSNDCFGIDLNRNFDFHWGETGSSTNPCSEVRHIIATVNRDVCADLSRREAIL